ncbi:MAG: DNA recombination protein RmuC [Candidatus Brocadiia bacterium]
MDMALGALGGLVVGGLIAWLIASARIAKQMSAKLEESERRANTAEGRASGLEGTIGELRAQGQKASEDFAGLRTKLDAEVIARTKAETDLAQTIERLKEEKQILDDARTKLTDTFKALAADTLDNSNSAFLKLARETFSTVLSEAKGDLGKRQEAIQGMVKPLSDSITKFDEKVQALEKARLEAYSSMKGHIEGLTKSQDKLQTETGNLVTALRAPQVRGRWGEMTLKRVVELAGMSDHCDFTEQVSVDTEAGRQRPDMIVHLPGGREIVVDAKVALDAYLVAISADTEEKRNDAIKQHARQVRDHMNALSGKAYWKQFDKAPEFVVMFIPGESFFASALDIDKTLIEDALKQRVALATPATLIALIRAVAFGWRQEQIAANAQEISNLGKDLHDRMTTMIKHIVEIGAGLKKATSAYNDAVSSMETRVLPAARRFKDLGASTGTDIPVLPIIEAQPRALSAPDSAEESSG